MLQNHRLYNLNISYKMLCAIDSNEILEQATDWYSFQLNEKYWLEILGAMNKFIRSGDFSVGAKFAVYKGVLSSAYIDVWYRIFGLDENV